MILSPGASITTAVGLLAWVSVLVYAMAAVPALPRDRAHRVSSVLMLLAWALHLAVLVLDIGVSPGRSAARLGFAPVLSATVWLVIAVHTVESRFVPLPSVRAGLSIAGALVVGLMALFPGEERRFASPLGPLHFVLGVASYGLFGAAVLHALLLDAAERRLKQHRGVQGMFGLPLLQLERLTFRFVVVGFLVLSATLALGLLSPAPWRWDHKTVFSLLSWTLFAGLLAGRRLRGWRGRRATRGVYAGAGLLLLGYVGSRFVFEVLLGRALP